MECGRNKNKVQEMAALTSSLAFCQEAKDGLLLVLGARQGPQEQIKSLFIDATILRILVILGKD